MPPAAPSVFLLQSHARPGSPAGEIAEMSPTLARARAAPSISGSADSPVPARPSSSFCLTGLSFSSLSLLRQQPWLPTRPLRLGPSRVPGVPSVAASFLAKQSGFNSPEPSGGWSARRRSALSLGTSGSRRDVTHLFLAQGPKPGPALKCESPQKGPAPQREVRSGSGQVCGAGPHIDGADYTLSMPAERPDPGTSWAGGLLGSPRRRGRPVSAGAGSWAGVGRWAGAGRWAGGVGSGYGPGLRQRGVTAPC